VISCADVADSQPRCPPRFLTILVGVGSVENFLDLRTVMPESDDEECRI